MAVTRKGYAVLITGGDAEIGAALADGIRRGREATSSAPCGGTFPSRGRLLEANELTPEQVEVVKAEMDRQKVAELLRVAMHREPVDYAEKCFEAEMEYGESLYLPGPVRKIGEKLLVGYVLIVLAFEKLFERVGRGE